MRYNRIYTIFILLFTPFSIYKLTQEPVGIWAAILTCLFIYLTTDFISGILHIILDNERTLNIPVLRKLAEGFQSHHENPKDIYTMTLYNHLYVMHLPLTFIFVFVFIINQPIVYLAYIALVISLHIMQMSHRWAHTPKKMLSSSVILLQKSGLLLSPKTHGKHHNGVYESNFSIMNGWSNFVLNGLVKIFGRTSHGWIPVFCLVLAAMLLVPIYLQKVI